MAHRRDIDGLRAIAVLAIILFHAGFGGVPGGYLGVDVFFVISGFLITGILLRENTEHRFSLAAFYERRARRILPALLTMLGLTATVGYVLLLPSDLRSFAQTLIAVLLFSSNVLFWKRSGAFDSYFDPAARLNPLLHTWSLGVEEQFYLVFPLLILVAWRLGRRWLFWLVALSALMSLVYSSLIESEHVLHLREESFYLLPPRAWQIALGGLMAFGAPLSRSRSGRWPSEAASLGGLALVVYPILTFHSAEITSPSLHALIPTVGTALVLRYGAGCQ